MSVRQATLSDVPSMVDLSEAIRSQYEEYQPLFWRKAKDSRAKQIPFFESQLHNQNIAIFVHESSGKVDGFIIANLGGGPACSVDDFALANENRWETIGKALLQAAGEAAKKRGIKRCLVVCAHLDVPKRQMLSNFGLKLERCWCTAVIQSVYELSKGPKGVAVRKAVASDTSRMAAIARTPGRAFTEIERDRMIVLVCEQDNEVTGYALASIITAPPVYDPGGPACLVLESSMDQPEDWRVAGKALLQAIQRLASQQGAVQFVVVCDESQQAKRDSLQELGLTIASEWYGGDIQ